MSVGKVMWQDATVDIWRGDGGQVCALARSWNYDVMDGCKSGVDLQCARFHLKTIDSRPCIFR